MFAGIHQLSDLAIFSIITLPFVALVAAASILMHRVFPRMLEDEGSFEIMDAFIAVASVAGIVLAFTLVEVDTNLDTIEANIGIEAEGINALDRAFIGYGEPLAQMRPPLRDYAKSIVVTEWPLLSHGQGSEEAEQLLDRISAAIHAQDPGNGKQQEIFAEALRLVDQVDLMREERIDAASSGLPGVFWKSVLALFAMLVLIASQTAPTRKQVVAMTTICATLGLLLSLTVVIDAPFGGETVLSPHEIERIAAILEKRI